MQDPQKSDLTAWPSFARGASSLSFMSSLSFFTRAIATAEELKRFSPQQKKSQAETRRDRKREFREALRANKTSTRLVLKRVFDTAFILDEESSLSKKPRVGKASTKRSRDDRNEEELGWNSKTDEDSDEPKLKYTRLCGPEEESEVSESDSDSDDFNSLGESDSDPLPLDLEADLQKKGEDDFTKKVLERVLANLSKLDARNRPKSELALAKSISQLGRTKVVFKTDAVYFLLILNEVVYEVEVGTAMHVTLVKNGKKRFEEKGIRLDDTNDQDANAALLKKAMYKIAEWCTRHGFLKRPNSTLPKKRFLKELASVSLMTQEVDAYQVIAKMREMGFIEVGRDGVSYSLDGIDFSSIAQKQFK